MKSIKALFALFTLIIGIMPGTKVAYAKDCISDSQCNQGEYCKGGGEVVPINGEDPLVTYGTCEPGIIIYIDANYSGKSQGLPLGRYDLDNISIGNDTLSSLKVPTGWRVTLYRHHHFTGETKVFTKNASYVGNDFNDETSSIVVSDKPSVIIYQHANYKGYSQSLPPGRYDLSSISIGNDTLSSLKVPKGWTVTLYRDHHFTGETKIFTEYASYVGNDFNDETSSIVVED